MTSSSSLYNAPAPTSYYENFTRFLFKSGITITGLSFAAVGLLYVKQEKLLYFPEIGGLPKRPANNPKMYRSPEEHNIRRYENIMIENNHDRVRTNAWLLLHENSKHLPTIIFFHGNAGNIGLRLPNAVQMFRTLSSNILMVEYRGFGDSDNVQPTEYGMRRDSEAALNFIRNHPHINPNKIFIFGRSLGGAVSFHLAQYAERNDIPVAGLIVENTFLSISKMVDCLMPFLTIFKPLVLRIGWDSESIASKLKIPILYLAGAKDELVPHRQMLELYALSKSCSVFPRIHIVKNGRHNETWVQGGRSYMESFYSFLYASMSLLENNTSINIVRDFEGMNAEDSSISIEAGSDGIVTNSAIPIMPKTFAGITKEATGRRPNNHVSKKQS